MTFVMFMFRSPYDQAALVVMAAGLALNVAIDVAGARRSRRDA